MDKKDKKQVKFGKEARDHPQKSYELFKVVKGADNPACKTHNTSEGLSKEYYKKRMAGSKNQDEPDKKIIRETTYLIIQLKRAFKRNLEGACKV